MNFVCDAMLGRTARFLRIFGYDTLYDNNYADPELLKIAAREKRTLLTRDVELYRQAIKKAIPCFLVSEKTHIDRLTGIILKGNLKFELDPFHSRCATCNAEITPIKKDRVKGRIPEGTFSVFDEFWICMNSQCGKIYYQGPHWVKIKELYFKIMKKLKEKAQ